MNDNNKCATFTETNFQEEVFNSEQPVLAVFRADWSGTCHIMTPILDDLCVEFEGKAKIGLIDIDNDKKLARDFGISNIPSLVFFENGQIVGHITGSVPKHIIAAKLNNMAPSTKK